MSSRSLIEIVHLFAYEGPNIISPQPGVLLRLRCDRDRSLRLKAALKDGAQVIGMVLAYLDVEVAARDDDDAVYLTATFTTPTPITGADLAAYVVAGMQHEAAQEQPPAAGHIPTAVGADDAADNEPDAAAAWDADTPLFTIQQQHRGRSLKAPVLQMMAEARSRAVPVLYRPDGRIQLGYGAGGWSCDPTAVYDEAGDRVPLPEPPWPDIRTIPIYAITGAAQREQVARRVAAILTERGQSVTLLEQATFAHVHTALCDPATTCLVAGLHTADILRRGVPFTTCTRAVITDMTGSAPAEAASTTDWRRALGIPMLLAQTPALLNSDDANLVPLVSYAPHGVLPIDDLDRVR